MSLQHQRVVELCNQLRLSGIAAQYTALAQKAAEKRISFTDFVEEILAAERESRRARAREMFARIAGFPLHDKDLSPDAINAALLAENAARCEPPCRTTKFSRFRGMS